MPVHVGLYRSLMNIIILFSGVFSHAYTLLVTFSLSSTFRRVFETSIFISLQYLTLVIGVGHGAVSLEAKLEGDMIRRATAYIHVPNIIRL